MFPDPNRRDRRKLLVFCFLVVALFVIDSVTGGAIRSPIRGVGASVWKAANAGASAVSNTGFFSSRAQLARENATLQARVSALEEQVAAAQVLVAQDAQLRDMVHLAATDPGTTAPVISSFAASPYGTFLIGTGSIDGVAKNALVLSSGGFVLGRIVDVQKKQSLVSDIFSPGDSIDVLAGTVPITLLGKGGGNAAGNAPRGTQVATGTPVFAPALGGKPIGFVGHTEGDAASAAIKVYVRTPINIASVRFVYVEKR